MRRSITTLWCILIAVFTMVAQEDGFSVKVSKDTILAGNVLQVSFIANNISGKFEAPEMNGLNVVSGPNTSSSMSIVNGTISQFSSYSYTIYAEDIGEIIIPPAYLTTSEGAFETEPIRILVLPNPEGIIEESPMESGMLQFSIPQPKWERPNDKQKKKDSKKKRKLKKI